MTIEHDETKFWTSVQKQRRCEDCVFFDKTRRGKMAFCTYAFALILEGTTYDTQVCKTRREEW